MTRDWTKEYFDLDAEKSAYDNHIVDKYKEYYDKVNVNGNYCDRISQLKSCIKRLTEELEDSRKYQAIQNDDIARLRSALLKIQNETASLGGTKKDMIESLSLIDVICDWTLRPEEMLQNPENVTENVANTESQH